MPNYIKIKTGSSSWSTATKAYVKKSTGWVQPIRIWMKLLSGWTRIWPTSGPFATTSPYIVSTASGSTHLLPATPIRVGTTYYGRNGVWDANGWTISSYNYQWRRYNLQDAGDDLGQTNRSSGTYSSPSIEYTPTAADDKKYLSFYISPVTTDTFEMSEAESGDDDGRLFVIRRPPVNTSISLSLDTKVGTAISYGSSWSTDPAYAPEAARTLIVWYRNTTASLTGATAVKVNLGTVAGAYSYTPVNLDIDNYIIAKETTFNSGSDYADGFLTVANTTGSGTPIGVSAVAMTSSVISGVIAAPTSLTATSNRGDGVFLEWDTVPGANYYEIYWQSIQGTGPVNQSPNADFGLNNSITTNSFLDTNILPGVTRYYRVRARAQAVSNGSNCSDWFPAPSSNAITGFRMKPGPISNPTAYSFSTSDAHGYFTTGTNTTSVQYKLQGLTIPISTPTYTQSTLSLSAYSVLLNVSSLFTERVWNYDTYSPSTTYYANNTAWLAGNEYRAKLISFSGSGTIPSTSGSNVYWTRGAVVGITPSTSRTWSASTSYTQGQTVYYGTGANGASVYEYTANDPGFSGQSPTNTTYWTPITTNTYYVGNYVSYNGTRYYVKGTTSGTYPNNLTYWSSALGLWRYEFTPYYDGATGDTVYSSNTRDLSLSHTGAGDPINLNVNITFTNVTSTSFTGRYTTGLYANYVNIDSYKTGTPIVRLTGYPKNKAVVTLTPYTETPTDTLVANTDYVLRVYPRYYYSPSVYHEGTGDIQTVRTLGLPPSTPTITYSSVGSNSFSVSWSASGATSYDVSIYQSVSGASVYSINGTTSTSYSASGLNPNTSYTTTVKAINSGGDATNTVSQTTSVGSALTPTFGTNTSTAGGFFGSVTNYDANYTWGILANPGSVSWGTPSGSTRPFTVSGLSAGQSSTVTVSAARTGYTTGSNTTTGSATNPTYSITFDPSGYVSGLSNTRASSPTPSTIRTGTVGQSASAPGNPIAPSGYTFAGYWRDDSPFSYTNQVNSGGSWTITATNKTFYAYYNAIVPNISQIVVAGNVTAGVTCTVTGSNLGSIEYTFFARDTATSAWVQISAGTAAPSSSTSATIATTGKTTGALPDQYYVEMRPYFGPRSTASQNGGTGTSGTLRSTIGSPKNNNAGSVTVNF
jgi:hypothetical protein